MKKIALTLCVGFLLCACLGQRNAPSTANATNTGLSSVLPSLSNRDIVVQKVDKDDVREIIRQEKMLAMDTSETDLTFSAVGEGIAPLNTVSAAQALALAKRAAMTDAYRQLAAKLFGVRINGKDTVKDAMLGSSTINAQVNGLIKNASVVEENFAQGLYRVNMELKISVEKWKELFSY